MQVYKVMLVHEDKNNKIDFEKIGIVKAENHWDAEKIGKETLKEEMKDTSWQYWGTFWVCKADDFCDGKVMWL